jgi:hypothetical protein
MIIIQYTQIAERSGFSRLSAMRSTFDNIPSFGSELSLSLFRRILSKTVVEQLS